MWQNRVAGLDLSANNISGSIPPELASLTNLELLILSNNHTTGTYSLYNWKPDQTF